MLTKKYESELKKIVEIYHGLTVLFSKFYASV